VRSPPGPEDVWHYAISSSDTQAESKDLGTSRGSSRTGTLYASLLGSVLHPPCAAREAKALPTRADDDKHSSGVAKWTPRHGFPSSLTGW
jgi:hypothetical protein